MEAAVAAGTGDEAELRAAKQVRLRVRVESGRKRERQQRCAAARVENAKQLREQKVELPPAHGKAPCSFIPVRLSWFFFEPAMVFYILDISSFFWLARWRLPPAPPLPTPPTEKRAFAAAAAGLAAAKRRRAPTTL
jgi:hypothetical protein